MCKPLDHSWSGLGWIDFGAGVKAHEEARRPRPVTGAFTFGTLASVELADAGMASKLRNGRLIKAIYGRLNGKIRLSGSFDFSFYEVSLSCYRVLRSRANVNSSHVTIIVLPPCPDDCRRRTVSPRNERV